jgi:hypothetical protein
MLKRDKRYSLLRLRVQRHWLSCDQRRNRGGLPAPDLARLGPDRDGAARPDPTPDGVVANVPMDTAKKLTEEELRTRNDEL